MAVSPHILPPARSVTRIMGYVLLGLLPATLLYAWLFGPAILVNVAWAAFACAGLEAVMLKLRGYTVRPFATDLSAVLTGWLLALSMPALSPWWLTLTGCLLAIVVAKHLYGGLGQNVFNPAMVGYAGLLISFPALMTQWPAPLALAHAHLGIADSVQYIFAGHLPAGLKLDAITSATPLDTLRTQLKQDHTLSEILRQPLFGQFGGRGFEAVAAAYLLGGVLLLALTVFTWHVPLAYLAGVWLTAGVFHVYDVDHYASPWFHLAAPSTMLAAFFIATDPVTGATTPRGKLIFGACAGFLTVLIRVLGGYPDGVAFSILLMNICVPLIDAHTQPKVFGHGKNGT